MNIKLTISGLFIATVLAACSKGGSGLGSPDSLIGMYGYVDVRSGAVIPLIKVAGENPAVVYEYDRGAWRRPVSPWLGANSNPAPVTPFTKSDLEKLVHHLLYVEVDGVQVRGLALVHVPAGWHDDASKGFTTQSGYFAVSMIGPLELVKMKSDPVEK